MANEIKPGQDLSFADIMAMRFAPKDGQPVEAKAGIPTREDIATMPKTEVVDWLEAHGVEGAKGKVADLRKSLTEIMYMEA